MTETNGRAESDRTDKEYRAVCACGQSSEWLDSQNLAREARDVMNGDTPPTGGHKEPCCSNHYARVETREVDDGE